MKTQISHYFLIVDLEATCCNNGSIPSHEMEIIEIGAVMLNRATWKIDSEFQQFIQPVRHPQLTSFCTELTSIRQQDINQALRFPEAISGFKELIDLFPNYIFCSWGNYDKKQFLQDCQFHNVPYPFTPEHINIKKEFSEYLGVSKGFGMAMALELLGIELKGIHHRGIDDARNIAAIYKYIKTQKIS
ncbi:exonuclease domain-containing protein [Nostoc sp. CENA67]|uniref:Exonuclease domain-containing protein n=1 Tax=Amazonocrinis nigriterrae CENA67 TaxID=2794033 RepID=A0A8J7HQK8_9NOST|nr:3'-5' exonuclease [Amazonocrinis nigriterrae]MBH8560729.1 exonuclease domain-containing protein [Amazonocrinis nigriterrae CENA67]